MSTKQTRWSPGRAWWYVIAQLIVAVAASALSLRSAQAQTDYYNTDAGRPIAVEDAYPVEKRAFELQLAPIRLERGRGGVYTWGIEPEFAFGILPRTHIEAGLPVAYVDAGAEARRFGLAGIELSVLHNLNVETRIPALAVVGDLLLPVGGLGPDDAYASLKGILTKTFQWARVHTNVQYTFGNAPDSMSSAVNELSRWLGGVAIDKTFPLRSALITAEVLVRQPIQAVEALEWTVGTGTRYQWSPRWAVDAGIGKRMSGDDRAWYVTFGSAYAFGLPWRAR